jgi:hypothetical protein
MHQPYDDEMGPRQHPMRLPTASSTVTYNTVPEVIQVRYQANDLVKDVDNELKRGLEARQVSTATILGTV